MDRTFSRAGRSPFSSSDCREHPGGGDRRNRLLCATERTRCVACHLATLRTGLGGKPYLTRRDEMADPNFLTGSSGLIAVDKMGNQVLFLDPDSYETMLTLDGFAPRVHELLIAADRRIAYVPIYGDGVHGKNPHPGHLIALFDLKARRHMGDFSTYPYLAPHGLRWGPQGQLYCLCENSGVVLEMDAATWQHRARHRGRLQQGAPDGDPAGRQQALHRKRGGPVRQRDRPERPPADQENPRAERPCRDRPVAGRQDHHPRRQSEAADHGRGHRDGRSGGYDRAGGA